MGLFSPPKPKQRVVHYLMTIHYGICQGVVDKLIRLRVKEKAAWLGEQSTSGDFLVNEYGLFGGDKKEGGLRGHVYYQRGDFDQLVHSTVAQKYDTTPAEMPGYRGLATAMFTEGQALIGRTPGFLWSANSPFIPPVEFTVTRISRNDVLPEIFAVIPPKMPEPPDEFGFSGGENSNPAYMIFDCLTDPVWGMAAPITAIDVESFISAAEILHSEFFGLSMIWTQQSTIESFVNIILDHIEATLFVSRQSGKFVLKLIRGDYDVAMLPLADETNSVVIRFARQSLAEITNEITVTWTNPITEFEETVTIQDIAGIVKNGGQVVSSSRNYFGVRDVGLAWELARRDLAAEGEPFISAEIDVDRSFWDVTPGDVIRVTSQEHNATEAVFRILKVNYGRPGDSKIRLTLAEDVYRREYPASSKVPTQRSEGITFDGSDMFDTSEQPEAFKVYSMTLNYPFQATSLSVADNTAAFAASQAYVIILPTTTNRDVVSCEMYSEELSIVGGFEYVSYGERDVALAASLTQPLAKEVRSIVPDSIFGELSAADDMQVGDFLYIVHHHDGDEITSELALLSSYDSDAGMWTVVRGILDTVPRAWNAGERVIFMSPTKNYLDGLPRQLMHSPDGFDRLRLRGSAKYKAVMQTSLGAGFAGGVPEYSVTIYDRAYRAFRPANITINASALFSDFDATGLQEMTLSWSNRNRLTETSQILAWDAPTVAPEEKQYVLIESFSTEGGELRFLNSIIPDFAAGTSQILDKTFFDGANAPASAVVWVRSIYFPFYDPGVHGTITEYIAAETFPQYGVHSIGNVGFQFDSINVLNPNLMVD